MNDTTDVIQMPDLTICPDTSMLFMFSAITWNRHKIHYDQEAARSEGHDDVVVQRALVGNFFARHLKEWSEGQGDLEKLSWKVVSSALPGQELIVQGTGRLIEAGSNGRKYHCEQQLIVASTQQVIANATAEVTIHS